jgi:V/A-type H+-transporting ATPase subunit I
MFYPQAMTEVELIVPEKDLVSVTRLLSGQGVFHQIDANNWSAEKDGSSANPWQEKASTLSGLERRIQTIMQTLGMDEGSPPADEFEHVADTAKIRLLIEQIELSVKTASDEIAAEHKHVEQSEATLKQLEPVADIDLDMCAMGSSHYLFSVLGMMPVENMERMQTSLGRIPYVFLPLRQDSKHAVIWLAGSRTNTDVLERATRSSYINPIVLPEGSKGTPAELIKSIQAGIQLSNQKTAALKAELARLRGEHQTKLQSIYWEVRSSRMLTDAIVRYGRLKYTYLIVGWVISDRIQELTDRLRTNSKETLIELSPLRRDSGRQDVPVAMQTSSFLRPFQTLVTNYGRPRYDELDPTILMTITFPLIFGAMFGDVGQGIIMAVLGWLIATGRFMKSVRSLGGLITACGVMATFFGFLYGSFFGKEDVLPWHLIQPMKEIMPVLELAIGFGVIMLSLGYILGIYNAWKRKDWARVLVHPKGLAGLILYWSLLLIALTGLQGSSLAPGLVMPVPMIVWVIPAVLAGIVVMLAELLERLMNGHRPLMPDGAAVYAIQAFFEMFETFISILSNTLSYVRVGAFAVAHGFLCEAFFILGGMTGPEYGIGWWIVFAIGTVFIVGFEGLIVGIQTMRLEYYEFFSKFFVGGGMRYEPLSLQPTTDK